MKWILVLVIVAFNALGDLLNCTGMKRQGEVRDFRPSGIAHLIARLARNSLVVGGIGAMAFAFLAQLSLLSISTLSFALPASASTISSKRCSPKSFWASISAVCAGSARL